jgi:hypothetical protein
MKFMRCFYILIVVGASIFSYGQNPQQASKSYGLISLNTEKNFNLRVANRMNAFCFKKFPDTGFL